MLDLQKYLDKTNEKLRYEQHNNDIFDIRYHAFVSTIVDAVLNNYNQEHIGLDFGSGTGPVITKMLEDEGYSINVYDYIVCCEVIEYFDNPRQEFARLKNMLKPNGSLYLKKKLYNEEIDFKSWHYKNDPTHVFFYHKMGLQYIKDHFGFSDMEIIKDFIIYKL